jgi:hypothetical protein
VDGCISSDQESLARERRPAFTAVTPQLPNCSFAEPEAS